MLGCARKDLYRYIHTHTVMLAISNFFAPFTSWPSEYSTAVMPPASLSVPGSYPLPHLIAFSCALTSPRTLAVSQSNPRYIRPLLLKCNATVCETFGSPSAEDLNDYTEMRRGEPYYPYEPLGDTGGVAAHGLPLAAEPLMEHRLPLQSDVAKSVGGFKSGLFDCFSDREVCCYGFWCTPCLYGENVKTFEVSRPAYVLFCGCCPTSHSERMTH